MESVEILDSNTCYIGFLSETKGRIYTLQSFIIFILCRIFLSTKLQMCDGQINMFRYLDK